ncbi:DUF4861 domain-containing protein [Parvularcula flava]|uniref:DUF4861 domain-containing protein n=1 Tax=Aquisalinus luteolus TaxID=1566827 RepID=A0A8J3A3W2_9PROT|nr:DUF4861 family protein [Aquisalinus luteolus]NHK26434.1 DUF4861 domain-containing protein [Aquisalinus luteolus]GGH92322.1 hypothetical protein GCM10011355_01550 [Aquisalinus luteolus]
MKTRSILMATAGAAIACLPCAMAQPSSDSSSASGWYVQDDFVPDQRLRIVVRNDLDRPRENAPVTITRTQLSAMPDVHELAMTLVDPALPGREEPSFELLQRQGGHEARAEENGAWIPYQFDDLDKDGLWDELFFMSDFEAGEEKVFYIYLGQQGRGWQAHETHAGIGSYVRHTVPFWESGNIGWKLWYPTDIDVFGKREPVLMSQRLYMDNLDGYGVNHVDPAFGSDIMQVGSSFGGGGIGVFDTPGEPDTVSRPRFTGRAPDSVFNAGPIGDTRYAFEVVTNGPVRSIIRAHTFNWDSGNGQYAAEQLYTAYAGESYSTASVRFTEFDPEGSAAFAVGMRRHVNEEDYLQEDGIVISGGPEAIRNVDDDGLRENSLIVDYVSTALVVPERFDPEFVTTEDFGGNHMFRITPGDDLTFDYLIAAGWSEGAVNTNQEEFRAYVGEVAESFNSPIEFVSGQMESK